MTTTPLQKSAPAVRPARPHPAAITSLILGVAGLTLTAGITSPFAWWKAQQALPRSRPPRTSYRGRGLAQIGRVLGVLGTVLLVVWLVLGFATDVSPVDIGQVFKTALNQALGPNAIVFALAAIGLNIHFGYTGLLNFGQAGFMAVGAYGAGRRRRDLGRCLLARHRRRAAAPRSCSPWSWASRRCGCAPTTWPSSRSRGRDHPADLRSVESQGRTSAATTASAASPAPSATCNPLRAADCDLGFVDVQRANDLWVMIVGWTLVALCLLLVWALMRSPWGRVLQVDPRGRGRRALARQERLRLQDAGPDPRWRHRWPGRLRSSRSGRPRSSRPTTPPTSPSSPTPPC